MVNRWMTNDISRLVLDANIMVSALMGRSFPLLLALDERGVRLMAALHQIAETRKILHEKSSYTPQQVDERMENLLAIVEPLHPMLYHRHEQRARSCLLERGQPDWPVIAASYETAAAIWSHDKDFFGSGAPVWSTKILKKQLERVAA